MAKRRPKPQNPHDDAAVRAAIISRKGPIIAAIITLVGAILVVVIGKWWHEKPNLETLVVHDKFVGRIIDMQTEKRVRQAKVSLESSDIPVVTFSDSEGIFSFPLNDPSKEIYIRLEADGYENYNLRIVPREHQGIQELRLKAVILNHPSPNQHEAGQTKPTGSQANRQNKQGVEGSSRVHGKVIDAETGTPISGARVSVEGFTQEAMTTGSDGEFNLDSHKTTNNTFRLRAEKKGYSSREQWHEVGGQRATIRLTRE